MRIVVLGDIHGNVEALKSVLLEADRLGPDTIFHTGDLVGYGPRPNETIDLVRERGIDGVRGNFDHGAAWGDESPWAAGDETRRSAAEASLRWTVGQLGYTQRNFLKDLPFSIDRKIGERLVSIFHSSPTDLYLPIDPGTPDFLLAEMAEATGADLHLFGHTHRPFHRVVEGRHFVNAGSVGLPEDGDPRACMAVIDLDGGVRVEFRRVSWVAETTGRRMEAQGPRPLVRSGS